MALRVVTGVGGSGNGDSATSIGTNADGKLVRCPLCARRRAVFHCGQCVRNGDIVHSAALCTDRFADKQLRLMRIKSNCKCIEETHNKFYKSRSRKEEVIININKSKERINMLKIAIQQKRDNIKNYNAIHHSLVDYNEQIRTKLPIYKENIETVFSYAHEKNKDIVKKQKFLRSEQNTLYHLRKRRLVQLVEFIFPISEIPISQSIGYGIPDFTERAIAEASQPAESSEESTVLVPLQIIAATLPVDGDYSQYCTWVSANAGLIRSTNSATNLDPVSQNPAYRISAALSYSAQLIRLLAFYLDVRLPYNVNYGDLCNSEIEERRFKRYVWKIQNCAAVVIRSVNCRRNDRIVPKEPPLHTLLRMCPPRPRREYEEDDWNEAFVLNDAELAGRGVWFGGADKDGLPMGTSDDEESEPPEHLHWDSETSAPDAVPSSPTLNAGIMSSAAASIVSIWRGWTAR